MAAVYLHLQALADRGTAPAETADIYDMFTAAMLRPLPPRRQKFLAVMGLADEFTGRWPGLSRRNRTRRRFCPT